MPSGRTRVGVDEEDALPYADEEVAAPDVGFRTPGGIVGRSAELEQQVGQLRGRVRSLEREVYQSRKALRRRRVTSAAMSGCVGATLGALGAAGAWLCGGPDSAGAVLTLILLAWLLGAVVGYKWDKGDFPDAPPERLR